MKNMKSSNSGLISHYLETERHMGDGAYSRFDIRQENRL